MLAAMVKEPVRSVEEMEEVVMPDVVMEVTMAESVEAIIRGLDVL